VPKKRPQSATAGFQGPESVSPGFPCELTHTLPKSRFGKFPKPLALEHRGARARDPRLPTTAAYTLDAVQGDRGLSRPCQNRVAHFQIYPATAGSRSSPDVANVGRSYARPVTERHVPKSGRPQTAAVFSRQNRAFFFAENTAAEISRLPKSRRSFTAAAGFADGFSVWRRRVM